LRREGWAARTVGEIVDPVSRLEPVLPEQGYRLMGVRWYGNGCRLHSETRGTDLKTKALTRVEPGDVTYNKMWTTKGAFAVVSEEFVGFHATSEYPIFRPRADVVDLAFLGHMMRTPLFVEEASSRCRGSTSRARLNPNNFVEIPVLLPPLPEQKKIAEILGSVDEAIQATQAVIDQTRKVKQGLLQRLFTRGIGHTRFKQTEIGEIPESWDVVEGDSLCERISVGIVVKPTQYYAEKGVRAFRSLNVGEGVVVDRDWIFIDPAAHRGQVAKSKLKEGDVLVVRTGAPGTACVVPRGYRDTNCIDIIFARPSPDAVASEFLAWFINSSAGKQQVLTHSGGLAQQHFNVGALKKMKIPLPSLSEQRKIADHIGQTMQQLAGNEATAALLRRVKAGLVSALLSGRVRTKVDR
jgi:type I restriction enzyme S subunit